MKKDTFSNLKIEKQNRFIDVALKEFATNDFKSASVTKIVKSLGIAKGSVYQYFENKLELWLFLKRHCETIKLRYIKSIRRSDYTSFWDYYRAMYANGVNFDIENPMCSLFLYRIGFKETSAETQPYLNSWKEQAYNFLIELIEEEKQSGAFNVKNSTEVMAHFMVTMSMSVAELLQTKYQIDFDGNIKKGMPLFGTNEKELMAAVDELIQFLERALK